MSDPDFGELVVRMVISLAVILGLLAIAYAVLRRRPGMLKFGTGGVGARTPRVPRVRRDRSGARATRESARTRGAATRPALRVLGRTGVGRSSTLVAVMFGDEVLLVGASDSDTPSVLSRTTLEGWERAVEREAAAGDRAVPMPIDPAHRRASTRTVEQHGTAANATPHPAGGSRRSPDSDRDARRSRPDPDTGRTDDLPLDATAASLSLIEALRDATARRH